ncbi:MAG: anti-sigma factor domain-containing protein [Minwuia sp.]|uniref:anti-sigma factor n=1 Tax=Minwuia sp. TaxID=2493630 RepID=UPI003A8529F0
MDDQDRLSPEERDALASEFALGVLDGAEREAAERLASRDPAFRQMVEAWQNRLAGLSELTPDVAPPDTVWPRIEAAMLRESAVGKQTDKPGGLFSSLWFWRGWAALATAAAVILAVVLLPGDPVRQDSYVALLTTEAEDGGFMATVDLETGMMAVIPLQTDATTGGRVHELWLIAPDAERPTSLGVIDARSALPLPAAARPGATLAVSLEPSGGSPTGLPTGPVVYQGRLRAIAK